MTLVCLLRHGETDWNKRNILQGREDIPLNDNGKVSAIACSKYLSKSSWDVIISSPLVRAKETAEIIATHLDLMEVVQIHQFIERDYGSASGLLPEERHLKFPDNNIPDQEDWILLRERAMAALNDVVSTYENQKIIIVSHGALINAILHAISEGNIGSGKTVLKNCSMSFLSHIDNSWNILASNKTVNDVEYQIGALESSN